MPETIRDPLKDVPLESLHSDIRRTASMLDAIELAGELRNTAATRELRELSADLFSRMGPVLPLAQMWLHLLKKEIELRKELKDA